jgi:alkylated DNA repair protein (DNA oxidative demethylase)
VTGDLFAGLEAPRAPLRLGEGAVLLPGFALAEASPCIDTLLAVAAQAPFRHMTTRGGGHMSVAVTNCGALGWTSDAKGYRYSPVDPESGHAWPAMPLLFLDLARRAAAAAGFAGFRPDAGLLNRYGPGAGVGLHQDRDEGDLSAPIFSLSLGRSAVFLWGGLKRQDRAQRIPVHHVDVVIWGGPSRMVFHGIVPLKDGSHELTGPFRYNVTLRGASPGIY